MHTLAPTYLTFSWPPSHSHILSASLKNKLAFPECTRTNPPQGAVQMPRKITTSLWHIVWMYFSVFTKIDEITRFKRSEETPHIVVAPCIAWLYFFVIWMEIWLGQNIVDILDIYCGYNHLVVAHCLAVFLCYLDGNLAGTISTSDCGFFCCAIIKTSHQANLIYIFEAVLNSGSFEFKKSLWKSSKDF